MLAEPFLVNPDELTRQTPRGCFLTFAAAISLGLLSDAGTLTDSSETPHCIAGSILIPHPLREPLDG
jgi:hypothetical protein